MITRFPHPWAPAHIAFSYSPGIPAQGCHCPQRSGPPTPQSLIKKMPTDNPVETVSLTEAPSPHMTLVCVKLTVKVKLCIKAIVPPLHSYAELGWYPIDSSKPQCGSRPGWSSIYSPPGPELDSGLVSAPPRAPHVSSWTPAYCLWE